MRTILTAPSRNNLTLLTYLGLVQWCVSYWMWSLFVMLALLSQWTLLGCCPSILICFWSLDRRLGRSRPSLPTGLQRSFHPSDFSAVWQSGSTLTEVQGGRERRVDRDAYASDRFVRVRVASTATSLGLSDVVGLIGSDADRRRQQRNPSKI